MFSVYCRLCGMKEEHDRDKSYRRCPNCNADSTDLYISEYEPSARDTQEGGSHYKEAGVQPWDVIDTWPIEQQIGFHRGNALKYVMRMGSKDESVQEIRKGVHYLKKLIEVLEKAYAGKTN